MIGAGSVRVHRYLNTDETSSSYRSINLLKGVALNASAGTRTVSVPTGKLKSGTVHKYLQVDVIFTRVAATDLSVAVTSSYDEGSTYGNTKAGSIASGVESLATYSVLNPTGVTEHFTFTVSVDGATDVKFVFSGTSAGASDLIDVRVTGRSD